MVFFTALPFALPAPCLFIGYPISIALFGLPAVQLGVSMRGTGLTPLTIGLPIVFVVVGAYFVYRGFQGMRIQSGSGSSQA